MKRKSRSSDGPPWKQLATRGADPARARHFLDLLRPATTAGKLNTLTVEQAKILIAIFSASQALARQIIAQPELLDILRPEELKFRRRKEGLSKEVASMVREPLETGDFSEALGRIRRFKQRSTLRIAARDLCHLAALNDVIGELSDVADVSLNGFYQILLTRLSALHGNPWHRRENGSWCETFGCVLGMGKLGGQELNYSSDVDVLFIYDAEGNVFRGPPAAGPGKGARQPVMSNNSFFNRLAENFIAEVSQLTSDGFLYRIDLRLRPEGISGPLSRSLEGYENYYSQWGQTWERMMLIKARGVAGRISLALEFNEMIQPFRYPRSIQPDVLSEVGAMKDRIENEVVKSGELERNVKLGRGGIREVEFIAQSQQLLHGGRQPFLQGPQTLPALGKLAQYGILPSSESEQLSSAYSFLRDVEHRLQMEENLQTHTIPPDLAGQQRLARLMGFSSLKKFQEAHRQHRQRVRKVFLRLFQPEKISQRPALPFPPKFDGFETDWKLYLAARGFREVEKSLRMIREFVQGPGYIHVSPRTQELALQLLAERLVPLLMASGSGASAPPGELGAEPPLSDPDRVLTRLDSFISAYGARPTLFELWNRNPAIFTLLVKLFDRSEFLAGLAVATPDLVDELVASGRLQQRKSAAETLADLRHGLHDSDQFLWLRKYHQAEFMRIGLRDILALADREQYLVELSSLADACLQYALEVGLLKHKLRKSPFAIIGLGKLGGAEIDYGSDLDILFVSASRESKLNRLASLAREIMELLGRRTEQGILFHVDARLRPDGEKGLLVNTLDAFETYYRGRGELWEIQTLSRTRFIAGCHDIGAGFQKMAAALTDFRHPRNPPKAFTPDWKQKIHRMRMRIEQERTPPQLDALAIKTGSGGLIDAEFVAQALCLENGWQEPNTLRALMYASEAGKLQQGKLLIENYRNLRRLEGVLRRWSYEGETVLPIEVEALKRVAIRCGFRKSDELLKATHQWRLDIRKVYLRYFAPVDQGA